MPARLIVFAAFACFLPVLAAQTAQPALTPLAAAAAKPDLAGEAVVIDKNDTVVRFAKDGSSVRALFIAERILSDAGCAVGRHRKHSICGADRDRNLRFRARA